MEYTAAQIQQFARDQARRARYWSDMAAESRNSVDGIARDEQERAAEAYRDARAAMDADRTPEGGTRE